MARRDPKAAQEPQDLPPYYIATAPLFIDGNQFARVHNVGDRVSPDRVARYGWASKVRLPDGYTAPDQSESEPDTANDGQATSSKEGA